MNDYFIQASALIDTIHKTPTKAVIIATGGGLGVFHELTHRGGGSATLLSGRIPYGEEESYELLGGKPDKLVSEEATRMMAMVAFQRALTLSKGTGPVIGVASSSVLQRVPNERQGREHFIYAALQTDSKTVSVKLPLGKSCQPPYYSTEQENARYIENHRMTEESTNVALILNLIAEGCGLEDTIQLGYNLAWEGTTQGGFHQLENDLLRWESTIEGVSLTKILTGTPVPFDCYDDGHVEVSSQTWETSDANAQQRRLLFPGSFNPIHAAHWEMVKVAMDQFHSDVEFEISITNVEKPTADLLSIERRLQAFMRKGQEPIRSFLPFYRVWITQASTFYQKAQSFPGATFIVGYDTAARICDPKFAGPIDAIMELFALNKIRFVVFGREQNGVFYSGLDNFPNSFCVLATANPEKHEHADVSSRDIRNQATKESR